jgi:hypothetical protein
LEVDDNGDDENPRGFKSGLKFSQCVCQIDLYLSVVGLYIVKKHLNYWELWKTVIVHWILQGGSCKGTVVLCKTCEAVNGELKCVVSLLLSVINLRDGFMSTSLCNLFGLKGLYYKV